jgi:hypothetical protein
MIFLITQAGFDIFYMIDELDYQIFALNIELIFPNSNF